MISRGEVALIVASKGAALADEFCPAWTNHRCGCNYNDYYTGYAESCICTGNSSGSRADRTGIRTG